jgi:C1A family cysteine protease
MNLILLLALCVSALAGFTEQEAKYQFVQFTRKFSKNYDAVEVFNRYNIFKDNLEFIAQHNNENHTYTLGVNEFSDLSHEEFLSMYVSKLDMATGAADETFLVGEESTENVAPVPNDMDWRQQGAVNPVKNQASCGSCWAFAAVAAMEGTEKILRGSLPNLSEQQLVDCAGSAGNFGCKGGWPAKAMAYVVKNGGICSTASYPYQAHDGRCNTACTKVGKTAGAQSVGATDGALVQAINSRPVAVLINASSRPFQSYSGGVFDGQGCGPQLDHAVTAIGWTSQAYLVRNSWGSSWGEAGYIRMARGNTCGILKQNVFAK